MLLVAKVGECLVVMEVDWTTYGAFITVYCLLADIYCITGCCFLLSAAVMTRSSGTKLLYLMPFARAMPKTCNLVLIHYTKTKDHKCL